MVAIKFVGRGFRRDAENYTPEACAPSMHLPRPFPVLFFPSAFCFLLSAFVLLSGPSRAATAQTNAAEVVRQSTFQDDLPNGKDPFYPKSARRAEKIPAPGQPFIEPVAQLALKGISGPANRRFALINNQPVAAGEKATVRIAGGLIKIHCWEIRENSVVISIEGDSERKELRLRDGI